MLLDRILSVLSSFGNILNVVDSFQEGTVILQASDGTEVVEIKTRRKPIELWLSFNDAVGIPVCHGDINKMSYSLTEEGFILYADVRSNTAQINWHAVFDLK